MWKDKTSTIKKHIVAAARKREIIAKVATLIVKIENAEKTMDDSPYTPPESDLENKKLLPKGFNEKNLSSRNLFLAGCISLLMIIIDIASYALSILSAGPTSPMQNEYIVIALIAIGLSIYLLTVLKKFLKLRLYAKGTDGYINILIILNLVSLIFLFFSVSDIQSLKTTMAMINIIALCPIGIVVILFGLKLKKLPEYPGLNFYAWAMIASGIGYATIVLFFLGFFVGILAHIPYALIMFTASAEVARIPKAP
ncbi:MAG: hypothetical protein D6B28_08830 [Gammaproteobacteria bacterium]|nr:MAG: hypothetical protein D6B28_08830 [Gammaproteobacteria bacterium]